MTNQREVRVRIWITEPDGRDVEVEQAVPSDAWPDDAAILAVLDSVVGMVRRRYAAPAAPGHVHEWHHRSTMGDPFLVCANCGAVREVDGNG
jgi:hypothetical protein